MPNHKATCYIIGRFDVAISFKMALYGVIDFKTSDPRKDSARMYSRQLHAYAYALEHPASGKLALSPITKLGLLYFYPDNISQQSIERLSYDAAVTWVEIEKDEQGFLKFIDGVLDVLELPEAPTNSPNCQWCGYINKLEKV